MKINLSKVTVAVAALALVLGTTSVASALTYTGTLKVGSRGAAVSSLQTCLNGEGMNAGVADGIFGNGTKAAVMRFQSANNLVADGIAGMMTFNKLDCSTTVNPNPTPNNGPVDLNDFIINGGTDARLKSFTAKDGDDDTVTEGASSQEIAHFEFTPERSDILMDKITFVVTGTDAVTNDETVDPTDTFDSFTLLINGDEIDTISDADEWDDDQYGTRGDFNYNVDDTEDVMSLDFNSINKILKMNKKVIITVEADVNNSVDGVNDGEQWDVIIPTDGIRVISTSGNNEFTGSDTKNATVSVEGEGADNALDIRVATDSPDAQTVTVDDTNRTEVTVTKFEIEASDKGEDLQINKINALAGLVASPATTSLTETYATVVYNTTLVIDGESYDVDTITTSSTANCTGSESALNPCLTWNFDRNEVVIPAGDTVDAEIIMEVKKLDPLTTYGSGQTVSVDVNSDDMDVEGDDSKETVTDLGGSITGEDQQLVVDGITVTPVAVSPSFADTSVNGATNDYTTLTIKFRVQALGSDLYIMKNLTNTGFSTSSTTTAPSATEGIGYHVQTNGGAGVTGSNQSATVSTNAEEMTNSFKIPENQTKDFTIQVRVNNDASHVITGKSARAILAGINWANDDVATSTSADVNGIYTLNMSDYMSNYGYVAD